MGSRRNTLVLFWGSTAAFVIAVCALAAPAYSEQRRRPRLVPVPEHVPPRPENTTACNYQEPQPFMVRANHIARGKLTREERIERNRLHEKAIEFRTKNYGYFEGFGKRAWNARSPAQNAKVFEVFGRKVRLNERIIPALRCVEEQIAEECKATPYEPRRLSGLRPKNTYHTNEVSNHVYGIAIDLDPNDNTCCGCVGRWAEHPKCGRSAKTIYDRMIMPECWVHVFERFGFHWLGRDKLQDTMHFEFLGDPNKIVKAGATSPPAEAEESSKSE